MRKGSVSLSRDRPESAYTTDPADFNRRNKWETANLMSQLRLRFFRLKTEEGDTWNTHRDIGVGQSMLWACTMDPVSGVSRLCSSYCPFWQVQPI